MRQIDCQDYNIIIGNIGQSLSSFVNSKKYSKIAILVDENTRKYCLSLLPEVTGYDFHIIEVPEGEEHKNIASSQFIWRRMLMIGMDRHSLLINLGGGVIGDMGGFCASTFMRGIDFIHIPTTLLSMVDSSIGGKLAVDQDMVKNIIGVFANPKAVFIDPRFLISLGVDQLRSGFAEVVKHGMIANDNLWKKCVTIANEGLPLNAFNIELIEQAILVKKNVVEKDPFEKGERKVLNFGHTVGHAVETESYLSNDPLLHGEAIFIGMVCENYLAYAQKLIPLASMESWNRELIKIFYRTKGLGDKRRIYDQMLKDKKNKNNIIRVALIKGIGSPIFDIEISREDVMDCLNYYENLNS